MKLLLDYTCEEIAVELEKFDVKSYTAKQIFSWLHKGYEFDQMTNISKQLREKLAENYYAQGVIIKEKFVSKDGTVKYLYQLFDGNIVEGVLMNYKYGNTICVSTQVGCRMGCTFCASTIGGLIRNLSCGEILGQVVAVNKSIGGTIEKRNITNIVLMGSGEPLDNYDNVIKFLHLVNDENGLNISYRNISLSTCGLVPKIYELAESNLPVNLTISLHSSEQEERANIMPIARVYPLESVIQAAKHYFEVTKRRVIFEYTLISGVNDRIVDAVNLSKLLRGFSAHVNLIRLNPVKESIHRPTTNETAKDFCAKLESLNVSATIRRQMGVDIEGACGQLRRKYLEKDI